MPIVNQLNAYLGALAVAQPAYAYGTTRGPRFIRIWKQLGNQTSRTVVCFVDAATGMVHRAESWKRAGRVLFPLSKAVA